MGFFNWLFRNRQKAAPTPPVASQQYVTMDVPQAGIGVSPVVISSAEEPVFTADTTTLPRTSAPLPKFPDLSAAEGVAQVPAVDARVVANVESLMREAEGLPIGSVRGQAVAH